MYSRFFKAPQQSFFLFGPRGTGKSTLLAERFTSSQVIDLLDPETFQSLSAAPSRLTGFVDGNPQVSRWIIDEVQRVPDLLPLVHQLIEKRKNLVFVLTGSSARKLRRTSSDLLGGRALECHLHPFLAGELGADFALARALQIGMLPLVWAAPNPEATLKSYLSLYMQTEVMAEGLIKNVAAFARFLEAISFSQGSLMNFSAIGRDCGVDRKTVQGYVAILEDLLLAFRLPVFTKKSKRELVVHEKFYYFDAGVFRAVRPSGPLDQPQEIDGLALETLVIQQVRAWASYRSTTEQIYFWRSRGGVEVDLVIYGKNTFWAIEIKNSGKVRSEDLSGLAEFGQDYPMAKRLLLYRGERRELVNGILCLPVADFLGWLDPINNLPENTFNDLSS